MDRDQFLAFARQEITDEYGGVPIGIDDAVERIADRFAAEVDAAWNAGWLRAWKGHDK